MKRHLPIAALLLLLVPTFTTWKCTPISIEKEIGEEGVSSKMLPHEWMYAQRAYPHNNINQEAIKEAYRITKDASADVGDRLNGEWELAGPTNVGGRITDIALHPTDQNIIYVGTTNGGVYKSTDGGGNWEAVFEEAGAMSIGNIAIAASNPNTLYVGSGEANGAFESGAFFGDGVYKTTDGGETWVFKGLENTQQIGRIVVDPQNADRVYVAAAGILYGKNEDRGLYRTTNGGDNWEKVLYLSDSTSCIDVVVNPLNANNVYAVTWERLRMPWGRRYGGLTSRIYRSFDSGDNWEQLTNGLPPDNEERGRIGLAISPSQPNVLYASYTIDAVKNVFDGIYKSVNGGTSWERVDEGPFISGVFATYGWFFGNLRIHPTNSNDVSCLGVYLYRSQDGGKDWQNATFNMHVDFHAVEFHPQNPQFLVAGNDGGVYISQNGGIAWEKVTGIPNNLFYNCEIDQSIPERIYAGSQDQGVQRTLTGAIDDFEGILGGDGFRIIVDPTDNNYVYAEKQFGKLYRSDNGGQDMECIFYCDPDNFPFLRTNWNTPIAMRSSDPTTLYYGAQQLYKGLDRGETFFPISEDLTDGLHPSGSLSYGTISAIGLAPSDPDIIYIGTDDGNVQVTFDGGGYWENISEGVPDRYVTAIDVTENDPRIVYVTLSGYRENDYQPHILTTSDGGNQWEDISENLPEIPINDVIVHPLFPNLLFIANDMGVWYSNNTGKHWEVVGTNMPFTVVNDLDLHVEEQILLAATYGRSMLKFDISQLDFVPSKEELTIQQTLKIFPNPAGEATHLSFDSPWAVLGEIQLLHTNGSLLKSTDNQFFEKGKNEVKFDLSGIPIGNYLIRVKTEKGIFSGKLVKGR